MPHHFMRDWYFACARFVRARRGPAHLRLALPVPSHRYGLGTLAILALLAVSRGASGQQVVRVHGPLIGQVVSKAGEPVGDANIDVVGTYWRTTTRRDGFFGLSVPPGRW